jgi:hypothetical protein
MCARCAADPHKFSAACGLLNALDMSGTGLDLFDAHDARTEQIWRSLEAVAQPAYFLSWAWIENWLAVLPSDERPSHTTASPQRRSSSRSAACAVTS